jgi:hypothetical protein
MEDNNQQKIDGTEDSNTTDRNKTGKSNEPPQAVSPLPTTGMSEQNLEELERKHGSGSRQGNSSIPLDDDETIGIP